MSADERISDGDNIEENPTAITPSAPVARKPAHRSKNVAATVQPQQAPRLLSSASSSKLRMLRRRTTLAGRACKSEALPCIEGWYIESRARVQLQVPAAACA